MKDNIYYSVCGALAAIAPLSTFIFVRSYMELEDAGYYAFSSSFMVLIGLLPSIGRNIIERVIPSLQSINEKNDLNNAVVILQNTYFLLVCSIFFMLSILTGERQWTFNFYLSLSLFYFSVVNTAAVYYKSVDKLRHSGNVRLIMTYCYQVGLCYSIYYFEQDKLFYGVFVNCLILLGLYKLIRLIDYNFILCKAQISSLKTVSQYINAGFYLLIFNFLVQLVMQIDIYTLKLVGTEEELAYYSFYSQLIMYATIFPNILISSFTTSIFKSCGQKEIVYEILSKVFTLFVAYFSVSLIVIFLFSNDIVESLFYSYVNHMFVLYQLSPVILLSAIFSFSSLVLIARGEYKFLIKLSFFTLVIMFLLKSSLYPLWGEVFLTASTNIIFIMLAGFSVLKVFKNNDKKS
ncbi:hypothetical protein [Shewanella algae]|uniref:hypothetical protein n=1 Tax=Shewanella algae TaxID=38313 RepID=UPI00313A9D5A